MITAVLDDDPTGAQAVSDVPVVLDWLDAAAWDGVREGDHAVHVLTNSRAYDSAEAGRLIASAATEARKYFPGARLLLRGDSTLRAHLWEEYEALRSVVASGNDAVPHLLVPALPAAGRVTVGGVQMLERDGDRLPLDQTEYARDGSLAYSTAVLSRWAEERSGGRFDADDAVRIPLDHLRGPTGAAAVTEAISRAARCGRPAAVVPDAETDLDLGTISRGLQAAEAAGLAVIVRSAPAFAAVLTGSRAQGLVAPPRGDQGVLVVCGSFVPMSTAQIAELERAYPGVVVTARVAALVAVGADMEVERLADEARRRIRTDGLAVVATERNRDPALADPASQLRIATALAQVARRIDAGTVIAKGGITSAVIALTGLGARAARVLGPVLPGVARWRLDSGTDYLVVPGNVGGPDLLVSVVAALAPAIRAIERC